MEECCGSKPEPKEEKGCCSGEKKCECKCEEGKCTCAKEEKKEGCCKESSEDSSSKCKQDPKDQQIQELTNTLQRLQADFENFRKRNEKLQEEFVKFASKNLIIKLLPLLENFDLAMQNTKNQDECIKGIKLIHQQLNDLFKSEGVKPIPCKKGMKFDPNLHEAMMTGEGKKDTILQVLSPGYTMHGKVIRSAKVKVAK